MAVEPEGVHGKPYRCESSQGYKQKDKKLLVIHPFSESIKYQYKNNREYLFNNKDVLPEFQLITLKSVQSIAGTKTDFNTWFEAYEYMCNKIKEIEFDIALIGAGAYGLPLAKYVKDIGKKAIHLGGVTQILFGIKGKRWEEVYKDSTSKIFNDKWIKPFESEKPENYKLIENGCYW